MEVPSLQTLFNHGMVKDESEQSSISSSVKELSVADEHGLRTSFRAIRNDVTTPTDIKVHVYDTPRDVTIDTPDSNDVTTSTDIKVHVYDTPRDVTKDTPDSVISTGSRAFMHTGNKPTYFNAGHLQQHYDETKDSTTTFHRKDEVNIQDERTFQELTTSDVEKAKASTNFSLAKSMREQIRKENSASDNKDRKESNPNYTAAFQSSSTYEPSHTYDSVDKPNQVKSDKDQQSCFRKLALFCALILLLLGGVIALIYFKKDPGERKIGKILVPSTEKPKPAFKEICKDVRLKLREQIMFNCSLVAADVSPYDITHMFITPPIYWRKGKRFPVYLQNKTDLWETEIDHAYRILTIRGPAATCTTRGTFKLEFYDETETRFKTSIHIDVVSEVLRVNVSLSQGGTENPNDFVLGCSTNSGCEESSVNFIAEFDNVTQPLQGVNFTCIVKYDEYNGYSVSCLGTIPDFLLSKISKITCKPKSSLLDVDDEEDKSEEIKLPECDLTKHCGYACKDDTDYYVVSRGRCDIFHRCYKNQPFTSYCAPGTFFDPQECACRHTAELTWCQSNGALKPNSNVKDMTCQASDFELK